MGDTFSSKKIPRTTVQGTLAFVYERDATIKHIHHNLQCQFEFYFVNDCLSRTHRIYLTQIYMHQTIPAKKQHPIKSQNTDIQPKLSAISPSPYELIVHPT